MHLLEEWFTQKMNKVYISFHLFLDSILKWKLFSQTLVWLCILSLPRSFFNSCHKRYVWHVFAGFCLTFLMCVYISLGIFLTLSFHTLVAFVWLGCLFTWLMSLWDSVYKFVLVASLHNAGPYCDVIFPCQSLSFSCMLTLHLSLYFLLSKTNFVYCITKKHNSLLSALNHDLFLMCLTLHFTPFWYFIFSAAAAAETAYHNTRPPMAITFPKPIVALLQKGWHANPDVRTCPWMMCVSNMLKHRLIIY